MQSNAGFRCKRRWRFQDLQLRLENQVCNQLSLFHLIWKEKER